ncbi:hypothetical protein FGG08_000558 [Glutinoglossum americanum]|uniref:Cytochrome b5 heme-binding domain-containing protein n=1 Tax=Glutinoglossum americanum TaxID=1670608 RepID=A0A9P8IA45_9PEZI|nr:hypothetical protein FGG08_000558 [Glutinoglossum americanum]
MASKPAAIALEANLCRESFYHLCSLLTEPECVFIDQISHSAVMDELGRFGVWVGNIGALQDGPSSLDYRLREASHIRQMVLKLLGDLNDTLQEAISIVSCKRPQKDFQPPDDEFASEFSGDGSSTDSDAQDPSNDLMPTTEIQQLFLAIVETITSLLKLSITIRNPAPRDRHAKSASFSPYDDRYDIGHVWQKFPHARKSSWLIDRLGKANSRRRLYLRYREKHREKLSKEPKSLGNAKIGAKTEVVQGDGADRLTQRQSSREAKSRATNPTATTTLVQTIASSLYNPDKVEENSDADQSVTSYATSIGEGDNTTIRVPPPPEASADEMPFECPYCFTIQTLKGTHSWKKHVFNDLEPYICTFKDCSLRTFPTRRSWFDHELQAHRRDWCCSICETRFHSAGAFENHMRQLHSASFVESQLSAIISLGETPVDKILATDCPFCDDWDTVLKGRMALTDPEISTERLVVTPEQFRRHVGRHMEQLALFVLPRNYYDDEGMDFGSDAVAVHDNSDSTNVDRRIYQVVMGGDETVLAQLLDTGTDAEAALLLAALNGRNTVVKLLIQMGVYPDAKSSSGETALYNAAAMGHVEVVRDLAGYGAYIDARDNDGVTALQAAAARGHYSVVELLVNELGANVTNRDNDGRTVLHWAAVHGLASLADFLSRFGLEGMRDDSGQTALHVAASSGCEDFLRVIAKAGPVLESRDIHGLKALHFAARSGSTKSLEVLIKAGAEDFRGNTALLLAAGSGHLDAVRLLIEAGAEPKFKALSEAAQNGHEQVVCLLLDKGVLPDPKPHSGLTYRPPAPLAEAAGNGHLEVVRLLLKAGADAELRSSNGRKALHEAAANGHHEVARLLIESKADINSRNTLGLAPVPLAEAAKNGHLEVVRLFIEKGASLELDDSNGCTALYEAAANGHLEVVRLLLESGAHPNPRDASGRASLPLFVAAKNGHLGVVRLLAEVGVDLELKAPNAHTALHEAGINGHVQVVRLLLKMRAKFDSEALYETASIGRLDVVSLLREAGADIGVDAAAVIAELDEQGVVGSLATSPPPPPSQEPHLQCKYCDYIPKPHPDYNYRVSNLRLHERTLHRQSYEQTIPSKILDSNEQSRPETTTIAKELTFAEVSVHNKRGDLYIVIHDQVYDVSSFADIHPGGVNALLDMGGKDATKAFEGVGHSPEAREILAGLFVAKLEQKISDLAPIAATPRSEENDWADWTTSFYDHVPRHLVPDLVLTLRRDSPINAIKFSPNGKLVAIGSSASAQIFDAKTGEEVMQMRDGTDGGVHREVIFAVCFSPDGEYLAAGGRDGTTRVWDTETGALKYQFHHRQVSVLCLDYASNGRYIASGCATNVVLVWDTETGLLDKIMPEPSPAGSYILAVAISPDCGYIAGGSFSGAITLWKRATGDRFARVEGHTGPVSSISFLQKGSLQLISGGWDGKIRAWELISQGGEPDQLPLLGAPLRTFEWSVMGQPSRVRGFAVAPDGRWVFNGLDNGSLQFWDFITADTHGLFVHKHPESKALRFRS